MTAPELAAPAVLFDIDEPDASDTLETLSDGLQATITASPEWQARLAALNSAAAGAGFDDDLAF